MADFPNPINYGEKASVSYDNVFEDYDKPLRKKGLQIGFVDTQSDEYIIFIHSIEKEDIIENLINDLGYNYYDLTDKKRKNIIENEPVVKDKFDKSVFLFGLAVFILSLFFTYFVYRGYTKEGLSFMVICSAIVNFIFYYISIIILLEELEKIIKIK